MQVLKFNVYLYQEFSKSSESSFSFFRLILPQAKVSLDIPQPYIMCFFLKQEIAVAFP